MSVSKSSIFSRLLLAIALCGLTDAALAKGYGKGAHGGCGPKTLFSWNGCCESDDDEGDEEGGFEGFDIEEEDPIVTDRPDFTEASSTVGAGRVQIEMGYTFIEDDDGTTRTTSHAAPQVLFRIGLFRDWFELRIFQNALDERNAIIGLSDGDSGLEDLQIGAKIALTEQCGCLPEMAIIPQMFVPTGDNAFTAGEALPGLNWVYSWELTDHIGIAGSTQGNRVIDDSDHAYVEFAQSAAIGYGLTDRLGAYTEWYALFPHSAIDPSAKPQHVFNGGFTYLITNDMQFDIEAGLGLNDAADDYFVATGLSVRY